MTSPAPPSGITELLIVSVSPQNLERGVLWFSENLASIKKARLSNQWWRDNTLIIEKDVILKPAEFTRRLVDLGYERTQSVLGRGLFAVRGGIVEVWPINQDCPHLVEFRGNVIAEIYRRSTDEPPLPINFGQRHKPDWSLEGLRPGSYVVHVDHGIGIFRGIISKNELRNSHIGIKNKFKIQTPNIQNVQNPENSNLNTISGYTTSGDSRPPQEFNTSDYFIIEYAPPAPGRIPDKLYVPLAEKDRLSPYLGFTTPTVHRLGGTVWFRTKRKALESAEKLAKELLELYAKRHRAKRDPYEADDILELELKDTFAFQETDGQLRAEEEIKKDLSRPIPMDRILCGDVGFGKTEVAIRAALRVIASGKQVAVLAPTTILVAQHERTFLERFGCSNLICAQEQVLNRSGGLLSVIHIASLSRLTPPKDEKRILAQLAEGKIDCLIGTHRILSKDVRFKNLGLVIIDEEQRFGVKQKERFKEMRSEIDVLSLSATPIPRTLCLALSKLRDISIIETPPPDRLPIQTFILPYSKSTILNAIQYELERNGQIYFLHNRIETIGKVKEELVQHPVLNKLCSTPGVKQSIGIIHGRMPEKEIVHVMDRFREGEIKILLATTIIENGLDISSVNTLIVDDATRLGLAEAHQLRGRIGRGEKQAFAYFLYKPRRLTEKALKRLEALKEYSALGSGYQIALRDLELRGAGNVLGREQSGTINRVGLNLYCQMLAEAIESSNA